MFIFHSMRVQYTDMLVEYVCQVSHDIANPCGLLLYSLHMSTLSCFFESNMFFRYVLAASVTSLLSECLSGENLPTLMVQIFTVHKHSVAFIGTPCTYRWLNDLLILPAAAVTVLGVVIMLT